MWTRGSRALHRKKYIYYAGILFGVIFLVIVGTNILNQKKGTRQLEWESKLPDIGAVTPKKISNIRVLIKTDGFRHTTHTKVTVKAAGGLTIAAGDTAKSIKAKKEYSISPDDKLFHYGSVTIVPKKETDKVTLVGLERGYGTPSYRGKLQLYSTAEGIVIVNELSVEEYLYAVVPSEMPSSYEKEALKVQAVCARSYAYCQMQEYAYPEYKAHVDDSTSFQVYGNCKEAKTTTKAIGETKGELLYYGKEVVRTYYYSTSCGHSTSVEAWGTKLTKKNRYLKGAHIADEDGEDYEKHLPWYRWKATIPEQTLSDLIELNTGTEIGTLTNVIVTRTGTGGIALQIKASGTEGSVTVETENKIRSALGGNGYEIERQDGTVIASTQLLPSAFFTITKKDGTYVIEGGGFGHGIGMSQNGANEMAKAGKTYEEILQLFYPGTKIR